MRTRSLAVLALFLFLSACAMAPPHEQPAVDAPVRAVPRPVIVCHDCGHIERVDMVSNVRATTGGKAVLGGVVGGVVAGKPAPPSETSKHGVQVLTFRIAVRMDDGRRAVVHQADLAPGLRAGSRIRLAGSRVLPPR